MTSYLLAVLGCLCISFAFILYEVPTEAAKSMVPFEVGKYYAHANPGTNDEPNGEAHPSVSIYKIMEVSGEKVKYRRTAVSSGEQSFTYEKWADYTTLTGILELIK